MKDIDVIKKFSHYEIYISGKFYCSCDNYSEVSEELEKLDL